MLFVGKHIITWKQMDWLVSFLFNVRNNLNKVFTKDKLEKLSGKLKNSGKTENIFFNGIFVWTQDHIICV